MVQAVSLFSTEKWCWIPRFCKRKLKSANAKCKCDANAICWWGLCANAMRIWIRTPSPGCNSATWFRIIRGERSTRKKESTASHHLCRLLTPTKHQKFICPHFYSLWSIPVLRSGYLVYYNCFPFVVDVSWAPEQLAHKHKLTYLGVEIQMPGAYSVRLVASLFILSLISNTASSRDRESRSWVTGLACFLFFGRY